MKKYLIIFIILFIFMGVFSMDILGRSIKNIQDRMTGQVNYRINVVKGVVESENINKTYNCYIAGETVVYPNIPTFSRNPKLRAGDPVTIEFINGCRETPAILAPEDIRERPDTTEPHIPRYALIVTSPDEFRLFDMNGNEIRRAVVTGWTYVEAGIAVDSEGNIYLKEWDLIKKYDSNLNWLFTKNIEAPTTMIEGINIGSDGYLYSIEDRALGHAIAKRSRTDLTLLEDAIALAIGNYSGAICLDSSGNFYIYSWDANEIEKWSSAGVKLASINPGPVSEYAGCGICGNYIYFTKDSNEVYYLPLDLSTYTIWNLPVGIAYCLTVADNHLILSGWGTGGVTATRKYDSDRNLIWEELLGGVTRGYKAGGYNF